MIRLAWRQFRVPAIAAAVALVVVGAIVLLTHPHVVDVYRSTVADCYPDGNCDNTQIQGFLQTYESVRGWLGILVMAVPGLVGLFWGAPLVAREIEQGTFRLAWTQSVTRSRWLAVQLAVVGLASVVVAGLISLMVTWWSDLHDRVGEEAFRLFDQRDIVPMGYALVAFLLGVAIGVFVRRVMPAMATTLVGLVLVRYAVTSWIRPALVPASHLSIPLDPDRTGFGSSDGGPMSLMSDGPHFPNAWMRDIRIVDRSGRLLTPARVDALCPKLGDHMGPPPDGPKVRGPAPDEVVNSLRSCVTTVGKTYHQAVTYYPARTYWRFQWLELGVYVAIAAVLVGVCFWGIRRLR